MNSDTKKTILLVEDEAVIAITGKMQLEKKGYTVHPVSTGEKAVQTIIDNILPVDLILMDIDLGSGIDGTEAAAQILDHKDIPVVFLSSHSEPEVVEKTEKITSYGYVVKSSSIVVLDASIKMAFKLFDAKQHALESKEKAEESEARYRLIANNTSDSIWAMNADFRFTYLSPSTEKLFGYSLIEWENLDWNNFVNPDYMETVLNAFGKLKSGKERKMNPLSVPVRHKNGNEMWVEFSADGLFDENEVFTGAVGISRDITERKQAEETLQQSETRLRSIIRNSPVGFYIYMLDSESRLVFQMFNPSADTIIQVSHEQFIGQDILEAFPALAGTGIPEMYIAVAKGELNTQNFEIPYDHRGIKGVYDVRVFQGEPGQAIVNFTDISERKQTENELRRNEKDLRESQRIAHVGSWRLNVATNQVVWTEELYNMYGFDPSLPPPPYTEHMKLFTPESWEKLTAALAHTMETGIPYTLELVTIKKDGSNGWMWVHGEAEVDSTGKTVEIWGAAQDITERKRVEEALKAKNEEFESTNEELTAAMEEMEAANEELISANHSVHQADESLRKSEAIKNKMVSNIGDVIVIIDENGINKYKSPNITKLFGWTPEELVGENTWYNIHPDDLEAGQSFFSTILTEPNAAGKTEMRYKRKDGNYVWIEISVINLLQDTDIQGILGNYHDITERKQAEYGLERTIYELKKSQEVAKVGNWVWYISQNRVEWSDEMYRIFGIDKEQFTGDLARVISNCIHPDDQAEVLRSNTSVMEQNTPIPVEYRIIRPDGNVRTVWAEAGELELDKTGKPMLLRGIIHDITERKRAEQDLIESENRFKNMFEHHNAAMLLVDPVTGSLINANEAASNFYGYSKSVLCSMKIDEINMLSLEEIKIERNNAINKNRNHFIFPHKLASGEIKTVEVHSSPIDYQGKKILFSIIHDITERKQAEQEIQKQLNEKETLLREIHHRVKNNIGNIEGFLTLQDETTVNPEAKSAIKSAITRVQSMRILYDKLLLSKDLHEISMKDYIEDLIDSLHDVFDKKDSIIIEKQISDFSILSKQAVTIGIIINELLTNVYKYAFKERDKGVVSISIKKSENKVTLIIQDNGIGIDEGIPESKSSGFGLTIVKMLVEQLNGTYSIVNENGTKSVIQFKV